MIREAIRYVEQDLNNFINMKQGTPFLPPLVVASTLMSQDGSLAIQQDKALVISLLSIQEEKVTGPGSSRRGLSLDKKARIEVHPTYFDLNLYLMLTAIFPFTGKQDDLYVIGLAIEYFQEKNHFDPANSPGLPPRIQRLNFEIYNLDFMQMSNVWSTIGAKHMPSVMYKARLQYLGREGIVDKLSGVKGSQESAS